MGMVIDLGRRQIKVDNVAELHFPTDDSVFYLRVIALVAQKMKDRPSWDAASFVSIEDIEDQAWVCNTNKPRASKSKESMNTNIYQTWRGKLTPRSEKCIYELQPNYARLSSSFRSRIHRLFEIKRGQGPATAAFRIRESPDAIEIVLEDASDCKLLSGSSLLDTVQNLTDAQKAEYLFDVLCNATSPWTYKDTADRSFQAVQAFWDNPAVRRTDHRGRLLLSLEQYADIFVQCLGITEASGHSLMPIWLGQLREDPWWEAMMTANRESIGGFILGSEPQPEEMIEKCIMLGDFVFVGWLFHRAYLASVVALMRDEFFAALRAQDSAVRDLVYVKWLERLGGPRKGDPGLLLRQGEQTAFKDLQHLTQVGLRYIE